MRVRGGTRLLVFILGICLAALQSCGASQNGQNAGGGGGVFTEFSAPDAGALIQQGTYPMKINGGGLVAGYVSDSNWTYHGFLRDQSGHFTIFDVPGAKTTGNLLGTMPQAINTSGTIAGVWADPINSTTHGFYRGLDGAFTTFDPPAGFSGVSNLSINDSGVVAGTTGNSICSYGFVRATDGTITTFDVPGACQPPTAEGAIVTGINSNSNITGYFFAGTGARGFIRTPDGTVTEFDAPWNSSPCQCSTQPADVNDAGAVVGVTSQVFEGHTQNRSFLRAPDGTFIVFDPPESGSSGSFATAINANGVIAGGYWDTYGLVGHAYIRNLDGTYITVDAPHTSPATGASGIKGINATGAVVGITGEYPVISAIGFVYQP
jgi:hypothetical protein